MFYAECALPNAIFTYTHSKYEMNTLHICRRKLYRRGLFGFLVPIYPHQAHEDAVATLSHAFGTTK